MQINTFSSNVFENKFSFIHDYYTLATALKVRPSTISYLLLNNEEARKNLIHKVKLKKGRVTFESTGALKMIQEKIQFLLKDVYSSTDSEHVLAYVKGKNPVSVLKENAVGCKYIVTCDIKKYFDNITFSHVEKALMHNGFNQQGAKLIARLTTVWTKNGRTLQQGSKASPVISNLVGMYFYDTHIKTWLENNKPRRASYVYLRYCDNLFLGLKGEFTYDFISDYRHMVNVVLTKAKFSTHDWHVVPNNHPKRNQQFLGAVLNEVARIDKTKYQRLRAILFNCCKDGLYGEANKYWNENQTDFFDQYSFFSKKDMKAKKLMKYLMGNISYIKSVSERQYTELLKLYRALERIEANRSVLVNEDKLRPSVFNALKNYKNNNETVEEYLEPLQHIIDNYALAA